MHGWVRSAHAPWTASRRGRGCPTPALEAYSGGERVGFVRWSGEVRYVACHYGEALCAVELMCTY